MHLDQILHLMRIQTLLELILTQGFTFSFLFILFFYFLFLAIFQLLLVIEFFFSKPQMLISLRLNNRIIDARTPANQAILRIQSAVCFLFREFLVR